MTLKEFFNTDEPYRIAYKVTGGDSLHLDLVSHVYLIMEGREFDDRINYAFAKYCWNQWTWKESSFNVLYRIESIQINEEITRAKEETEYSEQSNALDKYINNTNYSKDPVEWFKKEVVKLRLQGMTYRDIQKETGINKDYAVKVVKQFEDDFREYYYKYWDSNDNPNVSDAKL